MHSTTRSRTDSVANLRHTARTRASISITNGSVRSRPVVLALTVLLLAFLPANGTSHAGDTTFSVDAAAVQSFLRAVTPYDVVVGEQDLQQTLTLSNPREVTFRNGMISLKLDLRGKPFPIEMVLTVIIGVKWDEDEKAWMAYLASLPLNIPLFGKLDLAKYVDPYPIPQTFSQPAGNDDVQFSIDGLLKSLKILKIQGASLEAAG